MSGWKDTGGRLHVSKTYLRHKGPLDEGKESDAAPPTNILY